MVNILRYGLAAGNALTAELHCELFMRTPPTMAFPHLGLHIRSRVAGRKLASAHLAYPEALPVFRNSEHRLPNRIPSGSLRPVLRTPTRSNGPRDNHQGHASLPTCLIGKYRLSRLSLAHNPVEAPGNWSGGTGKSPLQPSRYQGDVLYQLRCAASSWCLSTRSLAYVASSLPLLIAHGYHERCPFCSSDGF